MNSSIKGLVVALLLMTGVTASMADSAPIKAKVAEKVTEVTKKVEAKVAEKTTEKTTSGDIQIYTTDNSKGKITGDSIEKAFADAGFSISGNNDMNVAFNSKFKATNHKMYHLFTVYKKELVLELIKVTPKSALFAPISMSFYMDKNSTDIHISSLTLDGIAKITGVPATNKHMIEYSKLLKDTLAKALPNGHFEKIEKTALKAEGNLITKFSFEMEGDDSIEDELEGIQEELEGSLETVGFVIAGFNKLAEEFEEVGYKKYDFFDAYSICKLPVIFEVSKKYPEAGAYAPCTFYMYKEKGSADVHMAYPSVYNWISSMAIEDKAAIKVLVDAEKLMIDVVNEATE